MGNHGAASARAVRAGKAGNQAVDSTADNQAVDSTNVNSGRMKALSLNDWPVSRRLFAVIVVALLMGVVFGGLRVVSAESSAAQFGQVSQLATLGQRLSVLIQDLQDERDQTLSVLVVGIANPNKSPLVPLDRQTNAAIQAVQQSTGAIGGSFPANIQADARTVTADISPSRLQVLRSALSTSTPQTEQVVITNYDAVINDMLNLADQVAQGVSDATLASDVRAFNALGLAKEQVSQQRALLNFAFNDNSPQIDSATEQLLQTAFAREFSEESAFQGAATPAERAFLNDAVKPSEVMSTAFAQELELAIFGNVGATPAVSLLGDVQQGIGLTSATTNVGPVKTLSQGNKVWDAGMGDLINSMQSTENLIADNILNRASQLQSGAQGSALLTGIITGVVLLLVLLGALLVARSLVLPLRRLRAGALDIASVQLPERVRQLRDSPEIAVGMDVEPIDVLSTDEIGQVARAFDQVHREAVRLAGEEAVLRTSFNAMFVNLSRRTQSLVERLARMIDSLEQNEDDPDRLSNLFSMDHMVTRMRRNSENLLLLAGHESARKWSEAVPLGDVTRAATSEIEQYNRVVLSVQPGVAVIGQAVSDVVHLLAELIENATIFSPKDTQVQMSAQELSSGGVLIEITDRGIGVSDSRLADMNWRLDNPPVMDVTVSRHMGLFAVARLAERHRIRIRLRPATPVGLTALVWLPETVIERSAWVYNGTSSWQAGGAQVRSGSAFLQSRRSSAQPITATSMSQAGMSQTGMGQQPIGWHSPGMRSAADGQELPDQRDGFGMPAQYGQGSGPVQAARPSSNWFRKRRMTVGSGTSSGGIVGGATGPRVPGNVAGNVAASDRQGTGNGNGGYGDSAATGLGGLPVRQADDRGADTGGGESDTGSWGPETAGWGSDGRRPADIVAEPVLGETTSAGLPMRVPQANLIPGSAPGDHRESGGAGSRQDSSNEPRSTLSASLPQRSPDLARRRLSGFQRGARRAENQTPVQEGEPTVELHTPSEPELAGQRLLGAGR
jgi:signal transduction histidine kinase